MSTLVRNAIEFLIINIIIYTTLEEKTVEGSKLKIDAKGMSVKVDNATVDTADITTDNGVIHVIDTVLMPK